MSRFHGEDDDYGDRPPPQLFERAIENCLNGRRGQAILRELRDALLAMPEKRLIENYLMYEGQVCALGALARYRVETGGLQLKGYFGKDSLVQGVPELEKFVDGEDSAFGTMEFGEAMGLPLALVVAISYENDDAPYYKDRQHDEERRYQHVLHWVESRIQKNAAS